MQNNNYEKFNAQENAQEKETEKSQSKALSEMIEIMKISKSKIQELTKQ